MKRKYNYMLLILNIMSLFLIAWIVFDALPLIPCEYSFDKIERINTLIVDLSIGVIISTVFYVILVYVPGNKRSNVVRSTIESRLRLIIENMQICFAYFNDKYSMNNDVKLYPHYEGISESEFEKIKTLEDRGTNFWVETQTKSEDISSFTECDYFYLRGKDIQNILDSIFQVPSIAHEDVGLIRILSKIKDNNFFMAAHILHRNKGKGVIYAKLGATVYSYYQLYIALLKYIKPEAIISIRPKRNNPKNIIKIPITVVK